MFCRYIRKNAPTDDDTGDLAEELDNAGPCEESPLPSPCPSPFPTYSSPYHSPSRSDEDLLDYLEEGPSVVLGSRRRKQRNPSQFKLSDFVNSKYWKQ